MTDDDLDTIDDTDADATDDELPELDGETADGATDDATDAAASSEPTSDTGDAAAGEDAPSEPSNRPSRWNVADDGTPPEADPDVLEEMLEVGQDAGEDIDKMEDQRTINTVEGLDEDEFFGHVDGDVPTIATRYDLEKAVPMEKKGHFEEQQRYWVNEPYAFISIFESRKENETKYYVIEPYTNPIEQDLIDFFSKKLRTAIKYDSGSLQLDGEEEDRKEVIEEKTRELLNRYNLYDPESFFADGIDPSWLDKVKDTLGIGEGTPSLDTDPRKLDGMDVRPEQTVLEENERKLSSYQVEKLLYFLKRNFIGYERVDPIKHDINVEDISCDGYNQPVFVYHGDYEQIITNVVHGKEQLDDFVIKLAQRSGKGISKRDPQVDCTLPDGSRAQLTLGQEVSDHGTNYTIRQFKDVPFTPVDLINWRTFGLTQMAFLWLAIENHKSLIFAGGTASGKTTSLNAVSLFIPSSAKIVSIEDTREVELPQRNWVASVTRPSFSGEKGNVDEFALLEAALRQRPDYIVMGEIRGEEGRTLFQVMSTGHTTYTTFHADSVGEVLKRFTTDPINVSKTLFTALDLVSIQTQTRIGGRKVRRSKSITEINHYDAENDEINVQDIYQWNAAEDTFEARGRDNTIRGTATLEEIQFDRGWTEQEVWDEIKKRELILAYLIKNDLNTYTEVAATVQAFINDPETILTLIAHDALEEKLESLREMESVLIDIDPEDEELVPRPSADEEMEAKVDKVLEETQYLLEPHKDKDPDAVIQDALPKVSDIAGQEIEADPGEADEALDDVLDGEGDEVADDAMAVFDEETADDDFEPVDESDGAGDAR